MCQPQSVVKANLFCVLLLEGTCWLHRWAMKFAFLSPVQLSKPMTLVVDGVICLSSEHSYPWCRDLPLSHIHSFWLHVFKATLGSTQSLTWIIAYSFNSSGVTDLHKCCLPRPVISRVAQMTWQWLQRCHINGKGGLVPLRGVELIFYWIKQWRTEGRIHILTID